MKLNEFICPRCGHRWFSECAYGTCDACQTFFYLSETRKVPAPNPYTNEWNHRNVMASGSGRGWIDHSTSSKR